MFRLALWVHHQSGRYERPRLRVGLDLQHGGVLMNTNDEVSVDRLVRFENNEALESLEFSVSILGTSRKVLVLVLELSGLSNMDVVTGVSPIPSINDPISSSPRSRSSAKGKGSMLSLYRLRVTGGLLGERDVLGVRGSLVIGCCEGVKECLQVTFQWMTVLTVAVAVSV